MSAVTSIALDDAQATPVTHTFIPQGPDANRVWWFEDMTGETIGHSRISLSLKRSPNPAPGSNAANRVSRVVLGVHVPALETLSNNSAGLTPPPTVAYIERCNVEFILPDRASLQNRKDLRKYVAGLLGNTQVIDMVEGLISVYA